MSINKSRRPKTAAFLAEPSGLIREGGTHGSFSRLNPTPD